MKKLLPVTAIFFLASCASQPQEADIRPIDGPVLFETVDLGDNRVTDIDLICTGSLGRTLSEVKILVSANPIDGEPLRVDCITTFLSCNQQGQAQTRAVWESRISRLACN